MWKATNDKNSLQEDGRVVSTSQLSSVVPNRHKLYIPFPRPYNFRKIYVAELICSPIKAEGFGYLISLSEFGQLFRGRLSIPTEVI